MKKQSQEKKDIQIVYQKILEVYPFLTKKENDSFVKKAKVILKKYDNTKMRAEDVYQGLVTIFKNPHSSVRKWTKPKKTEIRKKLAPTFEIKNKILYLHIPSWYNILNDLDKKLIDICLKNIKKYEGIIIDVRNNEGGSSRLAHNFASIFFKEDIAYGKFFKKNEKGRIYSFSGVLEKNKKYTINVPIAILMNRKSFSSTELFLAPFKVSKRATLIGETSCGGSANPISKIIKIEGKDFKIRFPTWRFFLKNKKQPIEKTKIKPDIFYDKKDIRKFAEKYLLDKNRL